MSNITAFDPSEHHIRLVGSMKTTDGVEYEFRAILDTGAPSTEFSDQYLLAVGLVEEIRPNVAIRSGLQTQKYNKLTLPHMQICGHKIHGMTIYVSHFEKNWGVDALIGLDFFRKFKVTIDYNSGQIVTEPFGT